MLAKRIIPCLDVMNGRTVKGVHFLNLKDAGDIVELGKKYSEEGADELVFLDITASSDKRKTVLEWVERVAAEINCIRKRCRGFIGERCRQDIGEFFGIEGSGFDKSFGLFVRKTVYCRSDRCKGRRGKLGGLP